MGITARALWAAGIIAGLTITIAAAKEKESAGANSLPSDAEIHKILAERIAALAGKETGIGIVVGTIGPHGRRVISYGHLSQDDPRALNGDTLFEIGSVTKVFTGLLLAEMVRRGEVTLADPVTKHLPAGVKVPEKNGRAITLLDLATHTSGLPFMTDEAPTFDDSTGAKYSVAQLEQFLARHELARDIASEWDYSNTGYWLLSRGLAHRAGMNYESLLQRRVISPLELKSTVLALTPKLKRNLAVGHNAVLQPAPSVNAISMYAVMPAAGSLYSTVNDLLTLLSVAMGYQSSPLAAASSAMLRPRREAPGGEQAVGWRIIGKGHKQLVMHDGGTLGYASAVAWDPKERVGVVVLSNQMTSVSDIARHLLRREVPLEKPTATKRTEIVLDRALLNAYAGRYEAAGEGAFVVVSQDGFLTLQLPVDWGLPKLRLRPESQKDFFVAELPLRVTFQIDREGRVSGLRVYPPRGQEAISATRAVSQ
jgi:D-alanyl-D-alanine-carboxypeptidase/D-alanyl-D-alanine-endopeptidase